MGLLDYFRRLKKNSRHENHTSHTQESSQSKTSKTNKTHRTNVTNDGSSRDPLHDKQHGKQTPSSQRSEHRNGNSRQTNHAYKISDSVKEQLKSIENYIDRSNKKRHIPIEFDIIILEVPLEIDRNLTEPRSDSQIRFICRPEKRWDDLYSRELRSACRKLKWHTGDQWRPCNLHPDVRDRLFKATARDYPVYKPNKKGIVIRESPQDYQICQRIDLLRDCESKSEYDSELKKIVNDIQKYIKSHKDQFEDMRSESKKSIITPRELIKKWQKEYHFEFRNVLRWLKKDVQSHRVSHEEGKHGHSTKKRVERLKSREHSGTESHESSRINRPHDSAIFLPATNKQTQSKPRARESSKYGSDSGTSTSTHPRRVKGRDNPAVSLSGTGKRAPSKSHIYESSDYGPGSSTPIHQRKKAGSRSPVRREPQSQSKHDAPRKTHDHSRPLLITTNSSPSEYKRGTSPGKSAHRESPRNTPRTPRTPHTPRKSLPQSSTPSHHGNQNSPARPGSSGRRVTRERSNPDLPAPSTSQWQSHPHLQIPQPQQHSNSKPYSPTTRNRRDGYPKPPHQDSLSVSPLSSPLKLNNTPWEEMTDDEKARHHKEFAEER